ncbi:MAG: alanine--tRNA ligase [Clostridia bacterium]|nr:alanine--tRNA ligase [Clostridia bacterium]
MVEERFAATIDAGLSILSNMIRKSLEEGKKTLTGDDVFRLYDTYGFPIDLTREIAEEQKLEIDETAFKNLMKAQKDRARAARANISGWSDASKTLLADFAKTEFVGYDNNDCEATVIGILADDMSVSEVTEGEFTLITDKTVFYGEGGGQVGDVGVIYDNDTMITVTDTKKVDGVYIHLCSLVSGDVKVGDKVRLEIDIPRRQAIRRNHSTCHLLQAALRQVLGNHVEQAGSYVDNMRVRFDFSHFAALTDEELKKVEFLVNQHILLGEPIVTLETDMETAKKEGAMALFGEKYGNTVRMVKMGNFSTELCGGMHLDNTGKAGQFKIISESSVAAGVRRIEGTTGLGVLALLAEKDNLLVSTAKELKAGNTADLPQKAAQLQNEIKTQKHEIEALGAKLAAGQSATIRAGAVDIDGLHVITYTLKDVASDMPRTICDDLKASDDNVVAVLALVANGKLTFSACCGKNAVSRGAHAGNILKQVSQICGGGGGGRPDSASSGGKDLSKLDEAFAQVPAILTSMLK